MSHKKVLKKSKITNASQNDSYSEIRKMSTVLLATTAIFCGIYLLTGIFITGEIKFGKSKKPETEKVVTIQYTTIILGDLFNQKDIEYYVLIGDPKDDAYLNAASSSDAYINKEGSLPVYEVDINDGLNKYAISDVSNSSATSSADLRIKDLTLIKVKNRKIVLYLEGVEAIKNNFS